MMRRSILLPILLLLSACAGAVPAPEETPYAKSLLVRHERAQEPDTEPEEALPELEPVPAMTMAEMMDGLLPVGPARLEELRRIAEDEEALTAFLEQPVTRDDVAALAWLRSPAVAGAKERLEAARTGYGQSADLEDLVRIYRSFVRSVDPGVGPEKSRQMTAAIAPWPNVSALSGEITRRTVEIARQGLRQVSLETIGRMERLHADAARLAEALQVRREDLALTASLLDTVRARLESGRANQGGYLAFRSRLEELRTELEVLEESRSVLRSQWNRLLSRREDAPLDLDLEFADPGSLPAPADTERLSAVALEHRPMTLKAELAAERASLAVRMAETMTLPRFDVGSSRFERERAGEAGAQRGMDFPMPGRMNMPRADFGVREAQVTEMRARARAAEAARVAARDDTRAAVRQSVVAIDTAVRRRTVARDELVPLAHRELEAVRGAFESGSSSYLDLLEAVRKSLRARLSLADAQRELAHARATLLETTGTRKMEVE